MQVDDDSSSSSGGLTQSPGRPSSSSGWSPSSSSSSSASSAGASGEQKVRLTDSLIAGMASGRVFNYSSAAINAIDIHAQGDFLVTSSDDESLRLYNVREGQESSCLFSKKYGVDLVRFTHQASAVICASKNDWDDTLRYLSIHNNTYLRYFKGHRDRVCSLAMSPVGDHFLSASLDATVRLWDLNANACQGMLRRRTGRTAMVEFDPQGLIFAMALSNNTVKLYDFKSYDRGPFLTFQVDSHAEVEWTGLKFSPDGKHILLSTPDRHYIVDSFHGSTYCTLEARDGLNPAAFTPDGQYVFSGTKKGDICVWRTALPADVAHPSPAGSLVHQYSGHQASVGTVIWNPRYCMFASACQSLHFWIPSSDLS